MNSIGSKRRLSIELRDSSWQFPPIELTDRCNKRVINAQRLARDSCRAGSVDTLPALDIQIQNQPDFSQASISSLCQSPSPLGGDLLNEDKRSDPDIFMSRDPSPIARTKSSGIYHPKKFSLVAEENNSTVLVKSRVTERPKKRSRVKRATPGYVKRCGHESILVGWSTADGNVHKAFRKRCKSWRCFRCRRRLSAKWFNKIKQVKDVALALTLTFDPKRFDRDQAEQRLGKCWSRLARHFRKVYGRKIEYLRLNEWHTSEMPHLHILLRGSDLPDAKKMGTIKELHSFFKREGPRFGFGSICYVQQVYNAQGAASYVLSDVTKTYQLRSDYRRGLRRIQASQKFFEAVEKFKPQKPDAYAIYRGNLEELAERITRDGGEFISGSETFAEGLTEEGQLAPGEEVFESFGFNPSGDSRFNLLKDG